MGSLCLSVRVSHRKKLSFNHLIFTATGFNFLKKICILSKLDEPTVLIQVTFSDCRTGCQVQKTAIILSSKWSNQDLKGRFWFLRTRKMKKSFPLMKQIMKTAVTRVVPRRKNEKETHQIPAIPIQ